MRFSQRGQIVRQWLLGFWVACIAIWGITALFTENFVLKTWVPELERNVPVQGWNFDNRSEGWARSRFGKWGLIGSPDTIPRGEPKVLIFGDSFVEAFQVSDGQKMHVVLNRLLREESGSDWRAIGVARRFQSIADYVFQIPVYEEALGNPRLHVIHLFTLEDVLPDLPPEDRLARFVTEPELRFERYDNEYGEIESPESPDPVRNLVYRSRLQFFLKLKNRMARTARGEGLRFSLGRQGMGVRPRLPRGWDELLDPEWTHRPPPLESWKFALEELDSLTEAPILFVYAPAVPTLKGGKVERVNPEEEHVAAFRKLCESQGVGFVHLGAAFADFYDATGRFANGFQSSRPWQGHYNEWGNQLVAKAIHDWIKENRHDLHPD